MKSRWFGPECLIDTVLTTSHVCGSRKYSVRKRSATTIAYRPSGVKYRLYGSVTGRLFPRFPVNPSIGVSVLPLSLST